MLNEVVDSLLTEDDVCSGLDDLVDHCLEVLLLLVKEGLHCGGCLDADLCVDLGLLVLHLSGEECDLCVLDDLGHPGVDPLLVDDETLDHVGIGDDSSDLLLHEDGLGVDDSVLLDCLACLDDEVGKELVLSADGLSGQCGDGDLLEHVIVGLDCDVVEDLDCLCCCELVSVGDDGGVNVSVDEGLGLLEELSCENDCGSGSVSALVILSLGDLDNHLGCRVLDIDLLEDGHSVVGDGDVSDGVNEHLVHSLGSKGGPDCICNCLCRCDVVELCLLVLASLGALFEHDDRLIASRTVHFSTSFD